MDVEHTTQNSESRTGRPSRRPILLTALAVFLLGSFLLPAHAGPVSELFAAVRSNDVAKAGTLLKNRPFLTESRIGDGISPLHLAALLNEKAMCLLLIKQGADPDVRTKGGFTPLHWTSTRDAGDAAEVLVVAGASPNAIAAGGVTPLHWAASKNSTNVVRVLIRFGADVNARTEDGLTPLHWAYRALTAGEEAATMIAYKAATELEEQGRLTTAPDTAEPEGTGDAPGEGGDSTGALPETAVTATDVQKIAPGGPMRVAPTEEPGNEADIILPLGRGQDLALIWVKSLRLWVGQTEVSNGQFRRFRPEHSSRFRDKFDLDRDDLPAVFVTWHDARAFCAWLVREHGDKIPYKSEVRLPTKAEWMAVARCGHERKYPWGDTLPPTSGNYADRAAKDARLENWKGFDGYNDGFATAAPVGSAGTNELGIVGMGGNVWEWCEDAYDPRQEYRVRLGASWEDSDAAVLAITHHEFDRPDEKDDTIGFRVIVAPKPEMTPIPTPAAETADQPADPL